MKVRRFPSAVGFPQKLPFLAALRAVVAVFLLALAEPFAAAQGTNPLPALEFSQYFYDGGSGVITKRYTLAGPVGGGRLYAGSRVARAGDTGWFYGAARQDVYRVSGRSGIFEGIHLGDISAEMAQQGWPTGTGYDATRGEVVLVSLGGEGYIHTYSPAAGWRLRASMGNWDFDNIEHHAKDDSYYGVQNSHVSSPGVAPIRLSKISREGTHGNTITVGYAPFGVGFNDHEAELVSIGDYLVLLLEPGTDYYKQDVPSESRIYLINPQTGESRLTYRKVWDVVPPQNTPPTVIITSPEHPSSFPAGTVIKLRATAHDSDGQITKVEFFANDALLGQGEVNYDASGNRIYELDWTPSAGSYSLKARATDNLNAAGESPGLSVAVQHVQTDTFELTFYPVQGLSVYPAQLFTKQYTPEGSLDGGRLLPGMQMVGDGQGIYYGTHWHRVYKVDPNAATPSEGLVELTVPAELDLSWPMGVAFDTRRNRLLLVTLGGEGYLYAYSVATGQWSVVASMQNRDYNSIVYDPNLDEIFALQSGSIDRLNPSGQIVGNIPLAHTGLAIGPGGYHTEMALLGGRIAVLFEPVLYNPLAGMESRIYMVDISTGQTELTFRKVWIDEPVNLPPTVQVLSPVDGSHFLFGTPIDLRASASDTNGVVNVVDYFVNSSRVARAVRNNDTGTFDAQWTPPAPGPYLLIAHAIDDKGATGLSQSIGFTVHETQSTVVSVRTIDAEATEGLPDGSVDSAEFEITRSDELLRDATIYFSLHGTATTGVDYHSVSNFVRIPAGATTARVTIFPIADRPATLERMETVALRLEPTPSTSSPAVAYQIDPAQAEAVAVIYEGSFPFQGEIEIALPTQGDRFEAGEPIRILVAASAPSPITQVHFTANGQRIGTSVFNPPASGQGFSIEAEDFDYDGGKHMARADVMPYVGGAYDHSSAIHNVDYFRRSEVSEGDIYRVSETPNVPVFIANEPENRNRGTWDVEVNYRIGWTDDGTWMNYTRNFPPGVYRVYAALAHGDPNATMRATLGKVTAGLGTVDQTVENLGDFSGPSTGNWSTSARVPLTRGGDPVHVALSGEQTLRFHGGSGDVDYLLLEPVIASVPPRLIWHEFIWTNAPLGTNVLSAEATLPNGMQIFSSSIPIIVGPADRAPFVRRDLPENYVGGIPFTVTISAAPPAGTRAYAVEDAPPIGWFVSNISDDGVFDTATRKVKFGPFTDALSRKLSYEVTPPTNAVGPVEFNGSASRDGELYAIAGDRLVQSGSPFHPADQNRDSSIELVEVTAYAAAWKAGETWPTGPSPIPMAYVTRAGRIWRMGEGYRFDPGSPEPLCWLPETGFNPTRPLFVTMTGSALCERIAASVVVPGATTEVILQVSPTTGTSAYAVEERIPAGWTVSMVSDGGTFDAKTRVVRWGLFLDDTSRTLSYGLSAPTHTTSVAEFAGAVSTDGNTATITGSSRILGDNDSTAILLVSGRTTSGTLELRVVAPQGQTGIIEYSSDLVNWRELQAVSTPDGTVSVTDSQSGEDQRRFYRFKLQ